MKLIGLQITPKLLTKNLNQLSTVIYLIVSYACFSNNCISHQELMYFFSLKLFRFTFNFKNILLANVISVQRRFETSVRSLRNKRHL